MRVPAAALTLAVVVVVVAVCRGQMEVTTLPPNPHGPISIEGECLACHGTYRKELDPHAYVIPVDEMCLRESCHVPDRLGRSHPRNVEVKKSNIVGKVPESVPLEDGKISCGSCHKPHNDWLSTSQCYPNQKAELLLVSVVNRKQIETPYYRSYFLRVVGTAEEGFEALCKTCHPK